MSNNSVVTAGRRRDRPRPGHAGPACGLEPERRVQPGAAQARQRPHAARWWCCGRADGDGRARSYQQRKAALLDVVTDEPRRPAGPVRRGVCEGAGSPAEINLRATTSRTWAWRRPPTCPWWWSATSTAAACSPHLFGTLAVLDPADQAPHRRASSSTSSAATPALLAPGPGPARRADRTPDARRRAAGPNGCGWTPRTRCRRRRRRARPAGAAARRAVAAGRGGPAAADLQRHRRRGAGLRAGRGRAVRDRAVPAGRRRPGVLPGTRATVADLGWLRAPGWPTPSCAHAGGGPARCWASAAATRCSGGASRDDVGSEGGDGDGLGLLPWRSSSTGEALASPVGTAWASRCAATRSTTGGSRGRRRAAIRLRRPAEGCGGRGAGHALARPAGERRVPPGAAAPGGRAGRPERGSWPRRTPRSPPSGSASWSCSATWSRST